MLHPEMYPPNETVFFFQISEYSSFTSEGRSESMFTFSMALFSESELEEQS